MKKYCVEVCDVETKNYVWLVEANNEKQAKTKALNGEGKNLGKVNEDIGNCNIVSCSSIPNILCVK